MPATTDSIVAVSSDVKSAVHNSDKEKSLKTFGHAKVDIIDIRRAAVEINLKDDILALFKPAKGAKKLPTLLLYDERGLQLFEQVSMSLKRNLIPQHLLLTLARSLS
jgi:hypothetical protein